MQTITSQEYIDQDIVDQKIADADYEVAVSPAFEYDGETVRVVIDGHHSLEAAKQAGVEPEFVEYDQRDHDAIAMIDNGDTETFLEVLHMGGDYRNAITGAEVW